MKLAARMRRPILFAVKLASLVLGVLLVFALGDALYSSSFAPLRPWHTVKLEHEFNRRQADEIRGFDDYLALEARLFAELGAVRQKEFDPQKDSLISRYAPQGSPYARRLARDWNRSFRLDAPSPKGVALVVHGLSDSPYSMKAIAEVLHAQGVTVYGLRLPGHGTLPGELDRIQWTDWLAAVELAMHDIRRTHPGQPLWYVGYSTGAALGIKLSLDAISAGRAHQQPTRLFMLSPAVGVSPFAALANVQRLISHWGIAQKARWTNVELEIDPYKYQSFAKNGGAQIAALTARMREDMKRLKADGRLAQLVPTMSFQSVVDATVSTEALVQRFHGQLPAPGSELVLFDINRHIGIEPFLKFSPEALIKAVQQAPSRNYRLTIITNQGGREVTERSFAPEAGVSADRVLDLRWPIDVYSLSHVAMPFRTDDPIYGLQARAPEDGFPSLGAMAMRGEKATLTLQPGEELRLRANPFFSYIADRIVAAIQTDLASR